MHRKSGVLRCAWRVHDIHALCPQFTHDFCCCRGICRGSYVGSRAWHGERANNPDAKCESFTDSGAFADSGYADAFAYTGYTDASADARYTAAAAR
jgi:hypothetical protein